MSFLTCSHLSPIHFRDSSPALQRLVVATTVLGLLTLALNSPQGHCVGQWTHPERRPCPGHQQVPTTGRTPASTAVRYCVPCPLHVTPALAASAGANQGDRVGSQVCGCKAGIRRLGFKLTSPLPRPHPLSHPSGCHRHTPTLGRLLSVSRTSLLLGFT